MPKQSKKEERTKLNPQFFELQYNVPIAESTAFADKFIIKGVAINETTTGNNHKFVREELKASAGTLKGVPLLVDHDNRVESIKGRVTESAYDTTNSRIVFEANVVDKSIREMIRDGRINSVSVGATVKSIEEEGDVLIPRGITFKELSLVAVPADSGATFGFALSEAYKSNVSHSSKFGEDDEDIDDLPVQDEEDEIEESKNVRRSKMEEKEIESLKEQLAISQKKVDELSSKVSYYEEKERKDLENVYLQMCSEKKTKAMDVSKTDTRTLALLIEQLKNIETPKAVEKKREEKFGATESFNDKFRIKVEQGPMGTASFTHEW